VVPGGVLLIFIRVGWGSDRGWIFVCGLDQAGEEQDDLFLQRGRLYHAHALLAPLFESCSGRGGFRHVLVQLDQQ